MKNKELLFPIDLRMFGVEEAEDDGYAGDDDEKDEGEESEETPKEDSEEESEEHEEPKGDEPPKDKKDAAIIKSKREAKEAKKEAEEARQKLAEAEAKLAQREADAAKEKRIDELIESGLPEPEAKARAEAETEVTRLKAEVVKLRFEKLEPQYPGISKYRDEIAALMEKYPDMTESELYLAKYSSVSAADQKERLEQEMAFKNRHSQSKKQEDGEDKSPETKAVKLNPADERAFQVFKKNRPNMTREQFSKLIDESTTIE